MDERGYSLSSINFQTPGGHAPGVSFRSSITLSRVSQIRNHPMLAQGSYPISTVTEVTGMTNKAISRNSQVLKLQTTGKGIPREVSHPKMNEIAIGFAIAKVSKVCASPTVAMTIAAKFNEPQRGRPIGGLFPKGRTVLVVCNDIATIHNVLPDGDIDSLLKTEAAIVIDLSAIINRVNSKLGTIR
jgi:hypothetical protein